LSAELSRGQFFALRRRSTGEALMGGLENNWQVSGRVSAPTMLLSTPLALLGRRLYSISLFAGEGFLVETQYLRFPGRGYAKVPRLDPAWFDDAELVVVESEFAGVVTRRVVIDPFVVPST